MSDKTLKRLVLGQLALLIIVAGVLAWTIVPKGSASGGIVPEDSLILAPTPTSGLVPIILEDFLIPDPTPVRSNMWQLPVPDSDDRELQELNRRIDCLEHKASGNWQFGC